MRHIAPLALFLLAAAVVCAADVPVAPREFGPSPEPNWYPRIVADGSEFVVLWWSPDTTHFARIRHSDEVLARGELGRPGEVVGAAAGPHGSVIAAFADAEGVHVVTISRGGEVRFSDVVAPSFSSMAWNGEELLIVTRQGDTIFTDATGRVLRHGAQLALSEDGWSSAAARGGGFAVAFTVRFTVFVKMLTSTGEIARDHTFTNTNFGEVSIGCAGANACLLIGSAGEPLQGLLIRGTPGGWFRISEDYVGDLVAPLWDGHRFLVTWTSSTFGSRSMQSEIRVSAVALDGSVTPVGTVASPDRNRDAPAIAYANGEVVVASIESTTCMFTGNQIIARSLVTNRDLRLTDALSVQSGPAAAANAQTALVAWTEIGGGWRIRARLFPFSAPAIDVSSGPISASPVIGTDGSGYLVAWRDHLPQADCRSVLRITVPGTGVVHTLGSDVDSGIQVVWNGSEYVVLWEQDDPAELFAMRIDRSGQPIDSTPIPLTTAEKEPDSFTDIDHEPAGLFWTGDGYLLVWRRSRSSYIPWYPDPPPQYDVRTTLLSRNLFPLTAPQTIAPAYTLAAATKGDDVVALWFLGGTMHAARISLQGTVLEQRDLGIPYFQPLKMIATRTGYAILLYQEILFLDDDLTLAGRRATVGWPATIVEMPRGLAEVYEKDGAIYFTEQPAPRRRRAIR